MTRSVLSWMAACLLSTVVAVRATDGAQCERCPRTYVVTEAGDRARTDESCTIIPCDQARCEAGASQCFDAALDSNGHVVSETCDRCSSD